MPIEVRRGGAGDIRGLIRLHHACAPGSIAHFLPSPSRVLSTADARALLVPPGGFSLVVDRVGDLAGIATARPGGTGSADVRRAEVAVLVADAWRGQGIGTALLGALAREARRARFEELVLRARADNRAVLPMIGAVGLRARLSTRDDVARIAVRLLVGPAVAGEA